MVESHVQTDGSAQATGALMRRMVDTYWRDMLPLAHMSPVEVFNIVKSIPFHADPPEVETLQRPLFTMNGTGMGGDCDDKCIAFASYCKAVGVPWQFFAVRKKNEPRLHHVLCRIYLNRRWVHADPTYAVNLLGRERDAYAEYVPI